MTRTTTKTTREHKDLTIGAARAARKVYMKHSLEQDPEQQRSIVKEDYEKLLDISLHYMYPVS
jgi:hypothetical protein